MSRAKEDSPSKSRKKTPSPTDQLKRFQDMARELGTDESPDALDRAFGRLDTKKKEAPKPFKSKAKRK